MSKSNGKTTGGVLYAQFLKALKSGSLQPWERDAWEPWERDLRCHRVEAHKDADLTGDPLEYEELEGLQSTDA